MADVLLDRIERVAGSARMNNHLFSAIMFALADNEVTRAQAIAALDITAGEEARFDDYKTYYDTLSTNDQLRFHDRVEAFGIILANGKITQATYMTKFGMT